MGLQIIKPDTSIDFIGLRYIAAIISGVIIAMGLFSLAFKGGPEYGIDFAGGIEIQVKFSEQISIDDMKEMLSDQGLESIVVQRLGDASENKYLLRTQAVDKSSNEVRSLVQQGISTAFPDKSYDIERLGMVGPKVGADLRTKALEALFYAVLLIAIYISGRFEQRWFASGVMAAGLSLGVYGLGFLLPISYLIFAAMVITLGLCWYLKLNYALGAVIALIHDVLITVGVFSLLNKEFDLSIVAALLTIVGYSLNDTIIVFDRIRENLRRKASPLLSKTINISINQTLSRTLLTSGTTLIVVLCLYVLGGEVIHNFAFALLVGVLVGTYSSIFVASPILLGFKPAVEEETPTQS